MMEWDGSLETGDAVIDAEHRRLMELFNELSSSEAAGDGAVREALDTLTEYVATHFANEEARMAESGLPPSAIEAHVEEHRTLTNDVRDRVLLYRTGSLTVSDLVTFLQQWLVHHVSEIDFELVRFLRTEG